MAHNQRILAERMTSLERTTNTNDQRILSQLQTLLDIFTPRASYVVITIGGTMPLQVGASSTATVAVLDQFGQPMPGFDFTANPPSWSVSDPALASVAAGSTPDTETITASAAGSEILSVSVPGVVNGTASLSFTVRAPAAVATSVSISTSPDSTG